MLELGSSWRENLAQANHKCSSFSNETITGDFCLLFPTSYSLTSIKYPCSLSVTTAFGNDGREKKNIIPNYIKFIANIISIFFFQSLWALLSKFTSHPQTDAPAEIVLPMLLWDLGYLSSSMFRKMQEQWQYSCCLTSPSKKGQQINHFQFLHFPVGPKFYVKATYYLVKTCKLKGPE